jgi:hypothetical protein
MIILLSNLTYMHRLMKKGKPLMNIIMKLQKQNTKKETPCQQTTLKIICKNGNPPEQGIELQLKKAFEYIRKDSYQNALKVRNEIVAISEMLSLNPERFAPDKFKINNDGSYRAFEQGRRIKI